MILDQADPEQHKRRASRQFGSTRQQGVDNGATDLEAGSDLYSTGRKTIHFVILTTTTASSKNRLHPDKTQSLPSAATIAKGTLHACA